jgi:uncharacterized membrane protein YedE/YeeE
MVLMAWLWLASPFVVIAVIARDRRLLHLVGAHHELCRAIGWLGVALLCLGAGLVPSLAGTLMFAVGAPLVGLVVWLRRDDGEGGDEGGPDPPLDWDDFERAFRRYVDGGGGRGRGPRAPAAR